jgi:hypoxia up-regulated 1
MQFPGVSPLRHSLTAIVLLVICVLIQTACAAVLAIDYGTEWTKAALVKPGIPLQIVLTKDTKRKEQSVVAFKKSERLYGTDAFNLVAPLPNSPLSLFL